MKSKSTDYSQNPQQKVSFFHIFLSLIVSSRRHRLQMENEADEVLLGKRPRQQATAIKNPRKMYGRKLQPQWERWVVSTIALPTSALRKRSRCYWKTRSNVKGQHAPTRNNQRRICMKKAHLLLRTLAVIGRYGPHLTIVMLFVTQNNF